MILCNNKSNIHDPKNDFIDVLDNKLEFIRYIETGAAESESWPANRISKELQNFAPQQVKSYRIMILCNNKSNIPDPKNDFIDV